MGQEGRQLSPVPRLNLEMQREAFHRILVGQCVLFSAGSPLQRPLKKKASKGLELIGPAPLMGNSPSRLHGNASVRGLHALNEVVEIGGCQGGIVGGEKH